MRIEELKMLEKRGIELMKILDEEGIKFTYDPAYGAYIIHEEEYETVCKDEKELESYIQDYLVVTVEGEECYSCKQYIDEYAYSPTIYFKDGTEENVEDIITGMTRLDMINYENDIKNKYENVDYVSFGEFCPYCLTCM